jgi:ferric-dicitrate binding protein FerR (iron transport regulator)
LSNNNEHIDRLIARYLSGEASPEEALQLEQWMDGSPENKKYFGDIRFVHDKTVASHKYIEVDTLKAWDKVAAEMKNKQANQTIEIKTIKPVYQLQWFRIAASIALIIGIAAIALLYFNKQVETIQQIAYTTTDSIITKPLTQTAKIVLNKQSSVIINTNKKDKQKEIILLGEAFLDIATKTDTTIIVRAEETYIKHIGTSFNVKAYPKDNTIEVFVETGKVAFYTGNNQGINLTEGETGIFNKNSKEFSKFIADNPNTIAYKTKVFVFRNTRLADAIARLNDVYPEKITIANNNLADCPITVTFDDESIYSIVSIIAETLDIKYTQNNTGFILDGTECLSK